MFKVNLKIKKNFQALDKEEKQIVIDAMEEHKFK